MNLDLLYPFVLWSAHHYLGFPNGPRGQTEILAGNPKGSREQLGFSPAQGRETGMWGRTMGDLASLVVLPLPFLQKMLLGANQRAFCVHFAS